MKQAQSGFSLIESLVVVAIAAILTAVAMPAFMDQMARRRLEGVASELSSDLQYARSEAISKNQAVQLLAAADGRSYSINYVSAPVSPPLKFQALPTGMTTSAGVGVQFDALRGMAASAADLTVSSSQTSMSLRASTSLVGRVRLCSPSGSFGGYVTC